MSLDSRRGRWTRADFKPVFASIVQICFVTGMRVRAGLVGAIFKKSLRLSNEDRAGRATGDIVNLMSVDATRLQDLCTYAHVIWSALFQVSQLGRLFVLFVNVLTRRCSLFR